MTALGKLIRTTAFKIVAVYLIIFAIFSAGVIAYLARHTQNLVVSQITEAVDAEMRSLREQLQIGGINRLVDVVEARAQQPGSNLYLLTTFNGASIVGNVQVPARVLDRPGWSEIAYRKAEDPDVTHESRALVRVTILRGGFRLLVGRDFEDRDRLRQILAAPARWALLVIVIMGIAGALFIARRVLKRIDGMTATSDRIMTGDLSGRLPVSGSGDEFDRLANNLNAMLERIEALMAGVKHVSDNIAHDLKTPLTRLRNQLETTLMVVDNDEARDQAAKAVAEADQLLATFNALLRIARLETRGNTTADVRPVSLGLLVRDACELYEALSEDKSQVFRQNIDDEVTVEGDRDLLFQMVSNLIDNAIKYTPEKGEIVVTVLLENESAIFEVADSGIGVPDDEKGQIFQRFYRVGKSRSSPGNGLGLSLVNAVTEIHQGTIGVFDHHPGAQLNAAAAGLVGFADAGAPVDQAGVSQPGSRAGGRSYRLRVIVWTAEAVDAPGYRAQHRCAVLFQVIQ